MLTRLLTSEVSDMGRKRSNGEGSIYYNERRKRWEAVLVTGWKQVEHPDGKVTTRPERSTFTGKTRKVVADKLDKAQDALDQGLDIPDARATIDDFAGWWKTNVLPAEGLAAATETWYRNVLDLYVTPQVGHRTLTGPKALTPGDVETMTGKLAEAHSHRVADAARTTLGKVLRAAEKRGRVGRNVARLAAPPRDRGKVRDVKALTVAEVEQLLTGLLTKTAKRGDRVLYERWHPVVVVGVTTGLRPGELLALHWADVRLEGTHPQVSVRHAFTYVGGVSLKAPKRDRSYRTVPLTPEAVAALKAWRRTQAAERLAAGPLWSTDWPDLVFTGPDGGPQRVDTFRHALVDTMTGAHPHRLRHTYVTHLLEAGVPIHHVAELAGDAVATIEATYSHVLRTKHEVVDVARGLVTGGNPRKQTTTV